MTKLIRPSLNEIDAYKDALLRGWSPNNMDPARTAKAHLAAIEDDPLAFVEGLEDLGSGPTNPAVLV